METAVCRRDFQLREQDRAFLDSYGLEWESVQDGGNRWVMLHSLQLPAGYTIPTADIAVLIPPSYPTVQIDMVFVRPALARSDGKPIPQTNVTQSISGVQYQRWSRHRTSQNPWRPGLDDLSSHISLVEEWLRKEASSE